MEMNDHLLPIIKIKHKQTGKCPPAAFVYRFFVLYFPSIAAGRNRSSQGR